MNHYPAPTTGRGYVPAFRRTSENGPGFQAWVNDEYENESPL
jgi:hypothetical protein